MIKLIGISNKVENYTNEFIPSVNTFDITSAIMSDDCKPYQPSPDTMIMIWLEATGLVGEIEIFNPLSSVLPLCDLLPNIEQIIGNPQLQIFESNGKIIVEKQSNAFTIWLRKEKLIDLQVVSNSVIFQFSNSELVGITALDYKTIEYT